MRNPPSDFPLHSVGAALRWAEKRLSEPGPGKVPMRLDIARKDAEVILAFLTGLRQEHFVADPRMPLDEETLRKFNVAVGRRAAGCPTAYITNRQHFWGRAFHVDARVLIPRPETEFLIEEALHRLPAERARVADACTGSGCIAVTLKKERPSWNVLATDNSGDALAVAARNASVHGAEIAFHECDLLAGLPEDETLDAIVSNPPYIKEEEWETLDVSVRNFEPRAALLAGPRGTEILERLAQQSLPRLRTGGWLIIEISPLIVEETARIVEGGGFAVEAIVKDYARRERVIAASKR